MGEEPVQDRLVAVGRGVEAALRQWGIEGPSDKLPQRPRGSVISTNLTYESNTVSGMLIIDNPPRT